VLGECRARGGELWPTGLQGGRAAREDGAPSPASPPGPCPSAPAARQRPRTPDLDGLDGLGADPEPDPALALLPEHLLLLQVGLLPLARLLVGEAHLGAGGGGGGGGEGGCEGCGGGGGASARVGGRRRRRRGGGWCGRGAAAAGPRCGLASGLHRWLLGRCCWQCSGLGGSGGAERSSQRARGGAAAAGLARPSQLQLRPAPSGSPASTGARAARRQQGLRASERRLAAHLVGLVLLLAGQLAHAAGLHGHGHLARRGPRDGAAAERVHAAGEGAGAGHERGHLRGRGARGPGPRQHRRHAWHRFDERAARAPCSAAAPRRRHAARAGAPPPWPSSAPSCRGSRAAGGEGRAPPMRGGRRPGRQAPPAPPGPPARGRRGIAIHAAAPPRWRSGAAGGARVGPGLPYVPWHCCCGALWLAAPRWGRPRARRQRAAGRAGSGTPAVQNQALGCSRAALARDLGGRCGAVRCPAARFLVLG
jgi:hypothetical protein